MRIVKPRNHTVIDVYKAWCLKKLEEDPSYSLEYDASYRAKGVRVLLQEKDGIKKIVMRYVLFRRIIETYNQYGVDLVIEGGELELGGKMGKIIARRVERNFNKPQADIATTLKMRKIEPGHPMIYRTEEDYCRISWVKPKQIPNEKSYSFDPAAGNFKTKFSHSIMANPVLKFNYRFTPYVPPKSLTA